MDVQFWIYIIIGVIYFLSRLLKKPAEEPGEITDTRPPERRRPPAEQTTTERPKQLTFEELLREITEGKQAQKPVPQPQPQPSYERFENDLGDEARTLEEVGYDEAENARVFKAYEDAKSQVLQRTSLEETLRLQDTVVDFGKFRVFETQKKKDVLNEYINIVRNPQSLKHAVVMSEILKRKF
jgi:hypothetical protein